MAVKEGKKNFRITMVYEVDAADNWHDAVSAARYGTGNANLLDLSVEFTGYFEPDEEKKDEAKKEEEDEEEKDDEQQCSEYEKERAARIEDINALIQMQENARKEGL